MSSKPAKPAEPVIQTVAAARRRYHRGIVQLEVELRFDQINKHRKDKCKKYDRCLDYACVHHWVSFSCALCNGKPKLPKVNSADVARSFMEEGPEDLENDEECNNVEETYIEETDIITIIEEMFNNENVWDK